MHHRYYDQYGLFTEAKVFTKLQQDNNRKLIDNGCQIKMMYTNQC